MRIKLENWKITRLLTLPSFEYPLISHVLIVSSKADVTSRPDGRWNSMLLTQFAWPSKLSILLLRFLESHKATVVSSEHVTKVLQSKNRTQLTQSTWACRKVLISLWVSGSNISRLRLSQAATRSLPKGENSRLKIAPWPTFFGSSSGSTMFFSEKCLYNLEEKVSFFGALRIPWTSRCLRYDSDVHRLELLQPALLVTAVSGFDSPIKDDKKFSTSFAYLLGQNKYNVRIFPRKCWESERLGRF